MNISEGLSEGELEGLLLVLFGGVEREAQTQGECADRRQPLRGKSSGISQFTEIEARGCDQIGTFCPPDIAEVEECTKPNCFFELSANRRRRIEF
jgi:hypothetical protein